MFADARSTLKISGMMTIAAFMFACGGEGSDHLRKRTGAVLNKVNRAVNAGTIINRIITTEPHGNNAVAGARG